MSVRERLVASFVQFLGTELRSESLSQDTKESLEVVIQCLESAYNISSSDARLLPKQTILEIFTEAIKFDPIITDAEVPEEIKAKAESLKVFGNELMKEDKYEEALQRYTEAIKLDPKNAIFYCNRAAAYSKLNQHLFALEDCKRAIEIDPNYSKAYARMGLAFSNLNDHYQTRDSYKKALELDPENESYARNLKIAEEKINEIKQDPGIMNDLFRNPNSMINMAAQILQDPNLSNALWELCRDNAGGLFGNLSSNQSSSADGTTPSDSSTAQNSGTTPLETIMRASREMVSRMEASNPQLLHDILRRLDPNAQQQQQQSQDNNNSNTGDGKA